jgi:hypothetical protein
VFLFNMYLFRAESSYVSIFVHDMQRHLTKSCLSFFQIYSSGNPTNIVNKINDVRTHVEVKTGSGRFTLFETGLCQVPFFEELPEAGRSDASFYNFVSSYESREVQIICCQEDAQSQWMIPPPTMRNLLDSIDDEFTIQTRWEFNRNRPKGKEVAVYLTDRPVAMNATLVAQHFKKVLDGNQSSVYIPNMYPRYFRVPGSGDVRTLDDAVRPHQP